ncbi:unnamed protein product [Protopolystoma xenopodis]|uniref:Chromatin-remodeling ATPase INO80 n=1 Tax=Protopolystoma xenopodis TaxID=117903 RepID=A0A3S5BB08_9PLAT|nr:unnamed protein product [Protopolystoma xenopodis]
MGLGKTIQTIAFLASLAEFYNLWGPFLIVTPASTLHNWTQEFARFVPAFRLVPYWGNPAERKVLRRFWSQPGFGGSLKSVDGRSSRREETGDDFPEDEDEAVEATAIERGIGKNATRSGRGGRMGTREAELHVVVTSYQVVLQDAKFINKTAWAYIVLDEAHAIKSTSSIMDIDVMRCEIIYYNRYESNARFRCTVTSKQED